MSEAFLTPGDLPELQRRTRLNALRLKVARQKVALSALRREGYRDTLEGYYDRYYDSSNYVDVRDDVLPHREFGQSFPTSRNDRDEGRNFPVFKTEAELALIRGAARLVTANDPVAAGVLSCLTNYVIGNGFQYAATARTSEAAELAATASVVIEEFLSDNDWCGDLDRELFQRSRVDGEYFLGLWHLGNGRVQARAIEPDQVTEPGNKAGLEAWLGQSRTVRSPLHTGEPRQPSSGTQRTAYPKGIDDHDTSSWTFGVHTDESDAQAVHGYYIQWTNRDTEWDYLPGGNEPIIPPHGAGAWIEHARLNVVRSVKRGLSDFFPVEGNLELARRVLRNMGEGSAVQAAIAWIQESVPGTLQAQVNTGTLSRADAIYTTPSLGGSRAHAVHQYDPATILKVPSGQRYLPGPLGSQYSTSFVTASEALLRTVALRWNLPEHLITASASNTNFAASLVAETPFVKYAQSQQHFYAQRDRKTLWRVLRFAWSAGRFGDVPWPTVRQAVDIQVTPPQIEVRDREKETRVRQMLHQAGILSRHTWSAQEGLNFDQEQRDLREEESSPAAAESPQPRPYAAHGEFAEALEWWDPEKHPRGGFPENRGWFSKLWGTTGASSDAPARSTTGPEIGGPHGASAAAAPLAATASLMAPARSNAAVVTKVPAPVRSTPANPIAPPASSTAPRASPSSSPRGTSSPGGKGISPAAGASAILPGLAAGSVLDQGGPRYVPNSQQKLDFILDVVAAKLRNSGLSPGEIKDIAAKITITS
jgi:hypothetical protein